MVVGTSRLCSMCQFKKPLPLFKVTRLQENYNLCSHLVIKWREVALTFAMVDNVREMSVKKFCKYCKYCLFGHFLFLVFINMIINA